MSREHEQAQECQSGLMAKACNRIYGSLEIHSIMRATVISALDLVDAEIGVSGLMMDDQMVFSEYFSRGRWSSLKQRFHAGEGVVGHIITHGRPYLSNDPSDEPRINPEINAKLGDVRQLIAIPICDKQDELVGCLLLFNKKSGDFTAAEQTTLEQLTSIASIAIDHTSCISEQRRIGEELQMSIATYRTLVEQIPAITYIATLDRSRTLFVSPQIETILGYSQDDFLSDPGIWQNQIHPGDRERVLSEIHHSCTTGEAFHSEYRIDRKNGEKLWIKDTAAVVQGHDQILYLHGVMYDLTERKKFEANLMQMAHFDELTGLANRSLFDDRLNQAIAQAKRDDQKFAVLYLDLDGFKVINDSLGHKAGDEVLAEAAARMQRSVRAVDTVARMGGDEFAIILKRANCHKDISMVARKLLKVISEPYKKAGPDYRVSASIGISIYPDDSSDNDLLITAADDAMYIAKNSGKSRHCFSNE